MENSLAAFEKKAEKNLLMMCQEKEKLQKHVHELKRQVLLRQRKQELLDILNAQVNCDHDLRAACPSRVVMAGMFGGSIYGWCCSLPGSKSVLGFWYDQVLVCDTF